MPRWNVRKPYLSAIAIASCINTGTLSLRPHHNMTAASIARMQTYTSLSICCCYSSNSNSRFVILDFILPIIFTKSLPFVRKRPFCWSMHRAGSNSLVPVALSRLPTHYIAADHADVRIYRADTRDITRRQAQEATTG